MPDPTTTAALQDWPCTNANHLGLCSDNHIHADHTTAACARCGEHPVEVPRGDGSAPAHYLCRSCGKASYGAWRFFRD